LRVLAIDDILLSVEEPVGDLVLSRVLQNSDNTFQFFVGQFTSTLVQVNISLLASNVSETTTHTLNGSQGNDDLVLTVNVGVEKTNDMLELVSFGNNERLYNNKKRIYKKIKSVISHFEFIHSFIHA
jgi:hypothetical protein